MCALERRRWHEEWMHGSRQKWHWCRININIPSAADQAQECALIRECVIGIHSLQCGRVNITLTATLLLPSTTRLCGPHHIES